MAQTGINSDDKNPPSKTNTPKEGPKEETMYVVEATLVACTKDCYKNP